MPTLERKVKAEQSINRLNNKLAQDIIRQRKKAFKQQIEFGDCVVKADMSGHSKHLIMGVLIEAKARLLQSPELAKVWETKGQNALKS